LQTARLARAGNTASFIADFVPLDPIRCAFARGSALTHDA